MALVAARRFAPSLLSSRTASTASSFVSRCSPLLGVTGQQLERQQRQQHTYSQATIDEANRKSQLENGNYHIRQTEEGKGYGIFARNDVARGELAFTSAALETYDTPTSHSVQTDWDRHVTMDLPAILVNHSCEANLGIRGPNAKGAYDFWALKDIAKDTEFTWDYETSEYEISTKFECCCGAPGCRRVLQGFSVNGKQVEAQYGQEHVAPYLLEEDDEATSGKQVKTA